MTDPLAARELAVAGLGIAYAFAPLLEADLAAGRLVTALRWAAIDEPGLFLYHRGSPPSPPSCAPCAMSRAKECGASPDTPE